MATSILVANPQEAAVSEKHYMTPLGYSTVRPAVALPPIDRRALMQNAHRIAARARPHMANYAQAIAYGLRTAWAQVKVAQSFAMLRAQVALRQHTAADLAASRQATRRCGSSFMYA
jgi:hypothetical protein